MSGALHDAVVLAGMAGFDAVVVAVWWFLCSRFVPRDDVVAAPPGDEAVARSAAPSALHRALGAVCLVLLIGLIVECSGSAVWYVLRYGFTR